MKKIIIKSSLFVVFYYLSFAIYFLTTSKTHGELIRMGHLSIKTSKHNFMGETIIPTKLNYSNFSEANKKKRYKFLSIGDSFSQGGISGYQNFLSKDKENTLMHVHTSNNPIEYLYQMIKGNTFDSIKVDYVILQSVERYIHSRIVNSDTLSKIDYQEALKEEAEILTKTEQVHKNKKHFFSDAVIKFPFYNLFYLFDDNAFFSKTYKVKINKKLFFTHRDDLFFFAGDIKSLSVNNDSSQVEAINSFLNKMSKKLNHKNIKLILLISPDKYDVYYDYIKNKQDYPKPLFFKHFDGLAKDYIYIETKKILQNEIKSKKEVYEYGGTHWSIPTHKLIAKELKKSVDTIKMSSNLYNKN